MPETEAQSPFDKGRSKYVGNIVLKVESYDLSGVREDCFPGVVRGSAAGGPLDGRRIEISIRMTATNARVPKAAGFAQAGGMSHTPPGGYIAFENVRESRGQYAAAWANRFAGPGETLRVGLPARIMPSFDRGGGVRVNKETGATVYNAHILHPNGTKTADSCEGVRDGIAAAFESGNAALLVLISGPDPDSAEFRKRTLAAWRGWKDGAPIPIEEAVEAALVRNGMLDFPAAFDAGAVCDIVPMEGLRVGGKVAESMDRGAKHSINLNSYRISGVGARIGAALRSADRETASKLEKAFLETAHPKARQSFMDRGWRGVWNVDVQRFFGARGVSIPSPGGFGFAVSTGLVKAYGTDGNGDGGMFLAKARTLSNTLPAQAVPTASDPEAHLRYHRSFGEFVEKAAAAEPAPDALQTGPAEPRYQSQASPVMQAAKAAERPPAPDAIAPAGDEAEPQEPQLDD